MPEVLDADTLRRWCAWSLDALRAAQPGLDALNVFPVADRDTGTNLLATWEPVAAAARASAGNPVGWLAEELAETALRSARGNSGAIVAAMLHGLARAWTGHDTVGAVQLGAGLTAASVAATAAVHAPMEGTILSVARAAAEGAVSASGDPDLAAVMQAAVEAAEHALAATPEHLRALREAGVVDAGGRGLVVLLGALDAAIRDERPAIQPTSAAVAIAPPPAARESGSDAYGYEVQYLLDAGDDAVTELRRTLARLGDSIAVVGAGGLYNVHAHVNDIGAAIEAGIAAGRPHRISVTRFADQLARAGAAGGVLLVAVAPAGGIGQLFTAAGAVTVPGGLGTDCGVDDFVRAARGTAGPVVLLPNDGGLLARAEAAADLLRAEGHTVAVLPTRSVVQGLAATAVHDPARRFADDVVAMSAAASATRYGAVTRADRDAQTSAGRCRAGDVLALLGDDIVHVGADLAEVARSLLDRMLIGGGELVTLVVGIDAPPDLGNDLSQYVAVTRPFVDAVAYAGGQARFPLLAGVE